MNIHGYILCGVLWCLLCAGCGSESVSERSEYDPEDEFLSSLDTEMQATSEDTDQDVIVHIIQKGDTLSEISQTYYGTSKLWRRILDANPGLQPRALPVGKKIIIPDVK